jgi:uncharacterized protein YaiE (UPF0345 family)
MRNTILVSSMVLLAAAGPVAGSASAGVIDAFTVGGNKPGLPFNWRETIYESSPSHNEAAAIVNTANNTMLMTRTAAGLGAFLVQWTNRNLEPTLDWTGLQSISFTISSTTSGSLNIMVASMVENNSSNRALNWSNVSIGTGSTTVTLNVGSAYGAGTYMAGTSFNAGAVNMFSLRVNGTGAFDGTISNLQYNLIPAPGALALLGASGLVGARRRRA